MAKKTHNPAYLQTAVGSSPSVPAVRVRFSPKDVDEIFDGTVPEVYATSYELNINVANKIESKFKSLGVKFSFVNTNQLPEFINNYLD